MNLAELAFGCFVYARMSGFDKAYLRFLHATGGSPDLAIREHRRVALTWLNHWGCRQFARLYHEQAADEILSWHNEFGPRLLSPQTNIWDITQEEMASAAAAYASLCIRTASCRKKKTGLTERVSFGPAGAAKILFAIRPRALVPWDDAIRKALGSDASEACYFAYLKRVKATIGLLAARCQQAGFQLAELPERLGRPHSTAPKLIDEYYWATITRKLNPPDSDTFQRWAEWSHC